ncbi:hypothetical protein CPT_Moonbeam235 [Bacillus phage Moonbeam]|uniref:Uncharacterized protein n=1 Tax=Bacillus phage Moonbeam TaxID=1540091 RepID=A0A0A0RVD3_9CAUD|nr:hypothetical protein CPT_Moonbeam4 [Bacillus phage Moonbeam]YP_009151798.1 hypothetical protein CPT_Moonbeam235 [Bacillus phage Moonbeam]AIW03402.1 hypothetical protein CPT_Moonbeam4 [Bacillus phage Moonbeam]AIW03633.1 hypothetical protein CPT_Moonbeam235 [Bacillus phage Moonbeam]
MNSEQYRFTLRYDFMGTPSEEDCFINKDNFYPYGNVKEGTKTRSQYGFMRIVKVYDEPHIKYGKFIAESITYEEMNK